LTFDHNIGKRRQINKIRETSKLQLLLISMAYCMRNLENITFSGVIAEREYRQIASYKVNPIFGRSLLGFEPNKNVYKKLLT